MTQPKTMTGGRTLLFERLIDFEPDRPNSDEPSMSTLSMTELKASIQREIVRLLDSRTMGSRRPGLGGTVMEYGLPDFAHLDTASHADRRRVEHAVRQAIMDFEPRLRRPKVSVAAGTGRGTLVAGISGEVVAGSLTEQLVFDVALGGPAQAA